jgi:hypothetical protein
VRAAASANSPACAVSEARSGSDSVKSPPSGMHTSLHTSQSARSFTSSASPAGAAASVTGTGSSSVPSKP